MFHRLQPKKAPAGQESVFLVSDRVLPADDRRPARPRRAARHRAARSAIRRRCRWTGAFGAAAAVPGRSRRGRATCGRSSSRRTPRALLVAVATDLLALTLLDAARRDGRRRRRRQLAALRRAARLRRPARGVLRDARGVRAAGAGPDHRRVGRRARPAAPTAWRCRRASSTSAARRRRRTSARRRRCWPTSRRCTPSTTGPKGLRAIARARPRHRRARSSDALAALGLASDQRAPTSTRCASKGPTRGRGAAGGRARAGINFRYFDDGAIGISLDETTTQRGRRRHRRGVRARRGSGAASTASPDAPFALKAPAALAAHERVPDAPGLQHASLRNGDDALHPQPRAEGRRPRHVDDSARLLHDEAERGGRDAAGDLAGVLRACTRSRRSSRRRATRQIFARARARRCAEITGLRRRVAAAELRRAGGVRRADGRSAPTTAIAASAQRDVVLIPPSAHGTNPASAAMAGLQVVVVACDSQRQHRARRPAREGRSSIATTLAALMVTYPVDLRRVRGATSARSAPSSTSTAARSTWTART